MQIIVLLVIGMVFYCAELIGAAVTLACGAWRMFRLRGRVRGELKACEALSRLGDRERARMAIEAGHSRRVAREALQRDGYTVSEANAIVRDATRVRKG